MELVYEHRPVKVKRPNAPHMPLERDELTLTRRTRKHMPADTEALKFYLSNVDPDNWKIKQDSAVSYEKRVEVKELAGMTLAEMVETANRIKAEVERRKVEAGLRPSPPDREPPPDDTP